MNVGVILIPLQRAPELKVVVLKKKGQLFVGASNAKDLRGLEPGTYESDNNSLKMEVLGTSVIVKHNGLFKKLDWKDPKSGRSPIPKEIEWELRKKLEVPILDSYFSRNAGILFVYKQTSI